MDFLECTVSAPFILSEIHWNSECNMLFLFENVIENQSQQSRNEISILNNDTRFESAQARYTHALYLCPISIYTPIMSYISPLAHLKLKAGRWHPRN